MYISFERLTIQPFALIHRPDTGALSNWVKGFGHINRAMHFPRYAPPTPAIHARTAGKCYAGRESITALKGVRVCSLGSLLALRNSSSQFN